MSNQFNSDDELLARLVREAGDPSVSPDPQYAKRLRTTILDRLSSAETVSDPTKVVRESEASSFTNVEGIQKMKRIAKFAVAATVLMALGIVLFWTTVGSSTNIAFADVAKALDSLRSATYDFTSEMKNPMDGTTITTNSKGFFLAPSLERVEMSISTGSAENKGSTILILDCLAAKGLTLAPDQKLAIRINISSTEKSTGGTASMFETVRRLVREGSTGSGENVESLGEKEIDGRVAVGFRTRNNMADMILWADPQTARLVRVDYERLSAGGHGVMSNLRYDMDLDPSLFSLEPPAGYTVQTQTVKMPVEDDLINSLRTVAKHNDGIFPAAIEANSKAFMQAMLAEIKLETDKLMNSPEIQQLREELMAQYGEDKAGFTKAWMKEWTKITGPLNQKLMQKHMWGPMFYATLQPENDSHYVGGGVKLDAPDRPILWYKPTGAENYRVIYADLSVKEISPDDVKKLSEAKPE